MIFLKRIKIKTRAQINGVYENMNITGNVKNNTSNKFVMFFLLGGFGGYTLGFIAGILDNLSLHQSISLAGHTLLSGGAAGLSGYSVLRFMKSLKYIAFIAGFGIGGGVFSGLTNILIKSTYFNNIAIIGAGSFPQSLFSGFIGGCAVGGTYILIQRFLKKNNITIS